MLILQYPKSFKALDTYVDSFNAQALTHRDKLKSGAVLTAKELVRIYGVSLLKTATCSTIDPGHLPSLQTNNEQLASLVKCSSRTIQRYIAKLTLAGIITCKLFHGSNYNYELWINPGILAINVHTPVNKLGLWQRSINKDNLKKVVKPQPSSQPGTNCRHTYTGNNFNNILSSVENVEKSKIENLNLFSFRKEPEGCIVGEIAGNSTRNTGEIVSRAEEKSQLNLTSDTARDNSLTFYTNLFWLMARNLLYKNTDLTDNQIVTAKKLIRKLYEPGEASKLQGWHEVYTQRLSLVYKFVQRDPVNRFVPLPYIFLDTNNPKGFAGTKQWYVNHLTRKNEIQCELILSKMIRTYTNNDNKDANRKKPALKLFRECENRLGNLGGQVLVDRFYAAAIQHEGYRKISSY